MTANPNKSWLSALFFGNYFYGFCAMGLSAEASLQQGYRLPGSLYYLLLFASVVFYYTLAYMGEPRPAQANARSVWYARHRQSIRLRQWVLAVVIVVAGAFYVYPLMAHVRAVTPLMWLLLSVFPIVAVLYYGINIRWFGGVSLRSIGWLKPFVIGFTWAGFVTVYPVVLACIADGREFEPVFRNLVLFVKNFMFVSVLCILFDIKDYATDANQQLQTFVVNNGLRRTIFYIIIPLSATGLGVFLAYAFSQHFSAVKILLNFLPFAALIGVAWSLQRRRPILYYLAIIDGLMLLKAVCGIAAMTWF